MAWCYLGLIICSQMSCTFTDLCRVYTCMHCMDVWMHSIIVTSSLWCGRFYISYIDLLARSICIYTWPFTPAQCWLLKLLSCYRKATADVYAVAINHKAGWGESKRRPGRSPESHGWRIHALAIYQKAGQGDLKRRPGRSTTKQPRGQSKIQFWPTAVQTHPVRTVVCLDTNPVGVYW